MKRALAILLLSCSPKTVTPQETPRTAPTKIPIETPPPIVEPTYENTSATLFESDDAWPPPQPEGGEWHAFERPWLHEIPGAPKTFYTASVAPDPKRKVEVQIVALDARQLELDMAIGAEGPFPPDEKTKGKWPRTAGKLPRDPAIASRVVVAFNGAFRLDQNAHGMMIRNRIFAPPISDAATLLMDEDARLGFGTWGPAMKIPSGVRSLRQNLDPLIDDGVIDPRHRKRWGGIIKAKNQTGQRAKRSGICRTTGGHLLYLWGDSIEAIDLGVAMKKAGCEYGIHLDMNAVHVGFVFMSYEDAQYEKGKSEALAKNMGITDRRYVHQPSPKEFFYATLRKPTVDSSFAADGHLQPSPDWLPAILAKTEGSVRTTFIDKGRVRFALTGGHDELDASGKRLFETHAPPPLGAEDRQHVLAAIDLGIAPKQDPLGLVLSGVVRAPLVSSAALVLDEEGRLSIAAAGEAPTATLVQAHALFLDGTSFPPPEEMTLAIGVTARGDLVIAERTELASVSQLVEALKRAGCVRALAPRGGKSRLERAGRDEIASGGAATRLYVLAAKPTAPTYRFDRNPDGSLRWPKVKKPLE